MRRSEREVKDRAELTDILNKCDACRLGLSEGMQPYVVPMNFGYEWEGDCLNLYFHCANEGRRLDIIATNNKACFEADCSHKLITADEPCDYSFHFESIIAFGEIEVLKNHEERVHGLACIMKKYGRTEKFDFPEEELAPTTILKLTSTDYSGKRLQG